MSAPNGMKICIIMKIMQLDWLEWSSMFVATEDKRTIIDSDKNQQHEDATTRQNPQSRDCDILDKF